MDKVGILSMQRVINHGSVLQGYGLMSIIKSLGYSPEFIDIEEGEDNSPIASSSTREFHCNNKYKQILKRLLIRYKGQKQKAIILMEQLKYLNIKENADHKEPFRTVVIGSDEVFNCTNKSPWGFTTQLFGDIKNTNQVITYAASCGSTRYHDLTGYYIGKINASLKRLKSISVRDKNTFSFVKKIVGKEPYYHLDPVLVYDFKKELVPCAFKKPFLLIYAYTNRINNPQEIAAIKRFAKEQGLEIVSAGVFQFWCKRNIVVSSFELLGYFNAAQYVVTDTFHGTVLSIKYGKKFASIIRESNRNKLEDLLMRFNLMDRKVEAVDKLSEILSKDIDYKLVEKIIEEGKASAIEYLSSNL